MSTPTSRPLLADAVPVEPIDDIAELRSELRDLREEFEDFRKVVGRDREQLGNVLHALRAIFSGNPVAAATAPGASQPIPSAAYDAWKGRLTPSCGKIIDALLIQPLSQTQMITVCGLAHSTVKASVGILRNNSLVEKDGNKWRLKRL